MLTQLLHNLTHAYGFLHVNYSQLFQMKDGVTTLDGQLL